MVIAATAFAFPHGACGAQTDATTSASFLKLPVGARNIAMGATGAAEASAYSLYWNPAGLASLEGRELAYSYSAWLADTSYQFLGYAQKTEAGTFGASIQYVAVPAIQKYDNTGAPLNDQYRPLDSLVSVSYARTIGAVSVGGTVKGIYSRIDDRSAQTEAADIGVRAGSLFGRKLSAGLVVQNIGPGLKYDHERAELPLNVKAGASYSPQGGLTLCLDGNKASGSDAWVGGGVEYMISVGPESWAGPRMGYESDRMDLGNLAGLTTGVGLVLKRFSFDYAFVPMGEFGDTHRLSLKVRFK
jgi:hypothetical protein